MLKRKLIIIAIALIVLFAVAGVMGVQATAGTAIDWSAITSGGGTASGGNVTLDGVLGQPIVGSSSGGNVSVEGGYASAQTQVKIYLPMVRK